MEIGKYNVNTTTIQHPSRPLHLMHVGSTCHTVHRAAVGILGDASCSMFVCFCVDRCFFDSRPFVPSRQHVCCADTLISSHDQNQQCVRVSPYTDSPLHVFFHSVLGLPLLSLYRVCRLCVRLSVDILQRCFIRQIRFISHPAASHGVRSSNSSSTHSAAA